MTFIIGAVAETSLPKAPPTAPVAPTNVIAPTVTAQMGDVGGRLFGGSRTR